MRPKKNAPGSMDAAARPAMSPEAQENYMINLAMKLVEQRLLEGTASSAETTHFLKLATSKSELEKAKLEEEAAAGQDRDAAKCKALGRAVRSGHQGDAEIQRHGRG